MSTSMPDTSTQSDRPERGTLPVRPSLFLCLALLLACFAATASGWGLTRLVTAAPSAPDAVSSSARSPAAPSQTSLADQRTESARDAVTVASDLVDGASSFHITFTVDDGGPLPESASGQPRGTGSVPVSLTDIPVGRGHVLYDSEAAPAFEHYFTGVDGEEVYRYDMDGEFVMTADPGISGLRLLNPPSAADRYLCSRDFGSARLREVLHTSSDLAFAGWEEIQLGRPGLKATYTAYHYTGTFTAMRAGFDPKTGDNTLTAVEDAEFDLWIDLRGYPRRFDHRSSGGHRESYEFHRFRE